MREVRWRAWPFRRDDGVELRPQQLIVGQQQIKELLLGTASVGVASVIGGASVIGVVRRTDLRHHRHPDSQALMACWSLLSLLMEILRGLACSATGIRNLSTPPS